MAKYIALNVQTNSANTGFNLVTKYPHAHCICVDETDGSLWTTGLLYRDLSKIDDKWPETLTELYKSTVIESHTQKYDSAGKLLLSIDKGGYSIGVDLSDNSVWIAGQKSIVHYSNKGEELAEYKGFSKGQKWLAVISATSEEKQVSLR